MGLFSAKYLPEAEHPEQGGAKTLQDSGLIVSVQIEQSLAISEALVSSAQYVPPPVRGLALLDTGSPWTLIDQRLPAQLGLQPVGSQPVWGEGEARRAYPTYAVLITSPGAAIPGFDSPWALAWEIESGPHPVPPGISGKVIVVIGRDYLRHVVLTYDGPAGSFMIFAAPTK